MKKVLMNQRFDADCAVPCVAMYLGKSYKYIFEKHFTEDVKTKGFQVRNLVGIIGGEAYHSKGKNFDTYSEIKDKKAILLVPSLNDPNGNMSHFVYWDGKRIIDPQCGRVDRKWYGSEERPRVIMWVCHD